jgi:hypothetical protein
MERPRTKTNLAGLVYGKKSKPNTTRLTSRVIKPNENYFIIEKAPEAWKKGIIKKRIEDNRVDIVEINWSVFLKRWKKTLLDRGIDREFEEFDLVSIKNIIENSEVRKIIFNTKIWNNILKLNENSMRFSIFGFFSVVVFLVYIIRGKSISLEEKRGVKSFTQEGFPGGVDDAFFFIESFLWNKLKDNISRNEFEKNMRCLRTFLEEELVWMGISIDTSNWYLPFAYATPKELKQENWYVTFHSLFTRGIILYKILERGIAIKNVTVRQIIEWYSLVDKISEICFE